MHRIAPDSTWSVSWAPDGDRLAISTTAVRATDAHIVGVVLMAADGSSRRLVPSDGFGARYSPDGTTIAVGTQQATKVMAPDGSGLRFLHERGLIAWSPDSRNLVVSDTAGDAIVSLAGCDHHLLTPHKNQDFAVVAFTGR